MLLRLAPVPRCQMPLSLRYIEVAFTMPLLDMWRDPHREPYPQPKNSGDADHSPYGCIGIRDFELYLFLITKPAFPLFPLLSTTSPNTIRSPHPRPCYLHTGAKTYDPNSDRHP